MLKAPTASLLNAIALVALGGWAYLSSDTPSATALIPVAFGVVLLLLNPGVRKENKVIAHIAVVVTLLVLLGLVMPLRGALGRDDMVAVARVVIMMATTVVAMVAFIKSFIDVRKAREAASGQ